MKQSSSGATFAQTFGNQTQSGQFQQLTTPFKWAGESKLAHINSVNAGLGTAGLNNSVTHAMQFNRDPDTIQQQNSLFFGMNATDFQGAPQQPALTKRQSSRLLDRQ